jgi:uncharacterized protein YdiU (UPF0061 family)
MNQPNAAQKNFGMFCSALRPLLASHQDYLLELDDIQSGFLNVMHTQMQKMWAAKLGLDLTQESSTLNTESQQTPCNELISELQTLMVQTPVDYTIFFRELSSIPSDIAPLKKSFYTGLSNNRAQDADSIAMDSRWTHWLEKWQALLISASDVNDTNGSTLRSREEISRQMKLVNPKYILREWFVVPAYQQATAGDYTLIKELQDVMTQPYAEQSQEIEDKYYRLKPLEFFEMGGLSHLSCSS